MRIFQLGSLFALVLLAGCGSETSEFCSSFVCPDRGGCLANSDCPNGQECREIDPETGEGRCRDLFVDPGCTRDIDCDVGNECIGGVCEECRMGVCENEVVVPTWDYVAVISATTNSDDIDNTNTPGPDIDTIELIADGQSTFATVIEAFAQGAGGEGGVDNVNSIVSAVTGPNDAIPTGGGNCSLAERTGFWSMGDTSGFVVVSFGVRSIVDGNTIAIWELDDLICDNVSNTRVDTYEVLTGSSDVDVSAIFSPADISGDAWLFQGASAGTGGYAEFTADLP